MASNTTNTSTPSPYYAIPYKTFKSFNEIGRLGIGEELRHELNLGPNEQINDSVREKARVNMDGLFYTTIPSKTVRGIWGN